MTGGLARHLAQAARPAPQAGLLRPPQENRLTTSISRAGGGDVEQAVLFGREVWLLGGLVRLPVGVLAQIFAAYELDFLVIDACSKRTPVQESRSDPVRAALRSAQRCPSAQNPGTCQMPPSRGS
jgi:hypothetical protein